MIVGDRDIGAATPAPAEISQKVHGTITDLGTRLLGMPEFNAALGRTFFERSFANGGRSSIDNGVLFPLGNSRYRVNYRAEPLRYSPGEIRNYPVNMNLKLVRFGPELDSDHSITGALWLVTHFIEDQNGGITEFIDGHILLKDHESYDDKNPATAFDKIPLVFPDIYRPIKL